MKGQRLPKMSDLEVNMRKGEDYIIFCKDIVSKAFGVCRWKCMASQKMFQDFISPSFEAFVILCYDNIYEWASSDDENKSTTTKWKYTSSSRNGRANGGWKKEAFDRLKIWYSKVVKDRQENKEFDKKLMDELGLLKDGKEKQKNNLAMIDIEDPDNDFGDFSKFAAV